MRQNVKSPPKQTCLGLAWPCEKQGDQHCEYGHRLDLHHFVLDVMLVTAKGGLQLLIRLEEQSRGCMLDITMT